MDGITFPGATHRLALCIQVCDIPLGRNQPSV